MEAQEYISACILNQRNQISSLISSELVLKYLLIKIELETTF